MKLIFHPRFEVELDSAYDYYEQQKRGLGRRFVREVYSAIARIKQYPEAWQQVGNQARRCQTKDFPFGVIYQIENNEIIIIAIANHHRKPNYWQNRIN